MHRKLIPALIVTTIIGLLLAMGQVRADRADAARGFPTAEQVERQFVRAQECRRALGVPVHQTRRHWQTARHGAYFIWMHDLWRSRYLECRGETQRANEDVRYAIRLIFRGPGDPNYAHAGSAAEQAIRVAWCESRWTTYDSNGQYKGAFQMGSSERAQYGVGAYATAVEQVRSAYRMFVAAGRSWGRWQCRPGSGGETSSFLGW